MTGDYYATSSAGPILSFPLSTEWRTINHTHTISNGYIPATQNVPMYTNAFFTDYSTQEQRMPDSVTGGAKESTVAMRGYFEVSVIHVDSGEVIHERRIVAESERKAELSVLRDEQVTAVDLDDVDVIVRRLADVRPKKQIQTVKVVKE